MARGGQIDWRYVANELRGNVAALQRRAEKIENEESNVETFVYDVFDLCRDVIGTLNGLAEDLDAELTD